MTSKAKITLLLAVFGVIIVSVSLLSCKKYNVPYDTKYLDKFHILTEGVESVSIPNDNLALYVDYSNCIAKGMSSPFYQKMVSPLTAATKEYWSIKGSDIRKEEGKVYNLLNNIEEVNYAALDEAINLMAERESESVMLTDGELFTQTATKNNPNNPYMHAAFKKWLLKGYDIHIFAEPFKETYNGQVYNKKRFYIIFTDDRIEGNFYDRVKEIINFEDFPEVDEFHLSGNYPWVVPTNGKASEPNQIMAADITYGDAYEIQDWHVDWKNIVNLISNAYDDQGNLLPNGDKLIGGLKVNKNAFGCYRIKDVDVKISNINADYFDIYNQLANGQKVGKTQITPPTLENFIIVDHEEFKKHGNVDLYFDINNFAPDGELDGNPFNYFKIDIVVKDLENILGNSIDMFNFDSVVNQGQTNVSISESLKNCVFDPDLMNKLKDKVLYT
ncbi:MAG: hypothetical protein K2H75_01490, partial [Muribaculaceae bacterium]|nr:hypothetical protein [Muribaculaceae bacterium]